jgi:hypothetical protein
MQLPGRKEVERGVVVRIKVKSIRESEETDKALDGENESKQTRTKKVPLKSQNIHKNPKKMNENE